MADWNVLVKDMFLVFILMNRALLRGFQVMHTNNVGLFKG